MRHARGGTGEPLNAKLLAFAELGPRCRPIEARYYESRTGHLRLLRDPPLSCPVETVAPSLGAATHASGPVSMFHWPDRGPSFSSPPWCPELDKGDKVSGSPSLELSPVSVSMQVVSGTSRAFFFSYSCLFYF